MMIEQRQESWFRSDASAEDRVWNGVDVRILWTWTGNTQRSPLCSVAPTAIEVPEFKNNGHQLGRIRL